MSLKVFHIVFVTLSVSLSLGFSKWCWVKGSEGFAYRGGSVAAFLFAILLLVYGVWFWKKIQNMKLS